MEAEWEAAFERLVAYAEERGDARVSRDFKAADGAALGQWVIRQRTAYKKGALSEARATRLEAVAGWVWDAQEAEWEEAFARLLAYVEEHGDARVPDSYKAADGAALGAQGRAAAQGKDCFAEYGGALDVTTR